MVSKDLFPDFNPKYPDFMEDKRNLNSDETEFAMENFARLPQSVKNQLIQSGQAPQQYMKNIDTTTNLKNQMFGASGTPPQALTGGALNNITDYIPQAQTLMSTLYGKTPEQQEREDRINTGTMFLNFFTKMAAEASKPGATGLGSASIAGADTAQLYIDRINKERERKLKEKQGVVSLATQLYSKDKPTGAPKDYTVVNANQVNKALGTTYKQGEKATLTVNEFNKVPRGSLVGYEKDTEKFTKPDKYKILNVAEFSKYIDLPSTNPLTGEAWKEGDTIDLTAEQFGKVPLGTLSTFKEESPPKPIRYERLRNNIISNFKIFNTEGELPPGGLTTLLSDITELRDTKLVPIPDPKDPSKTVMTLQQGVNMYDILEKEFGKEAVDKLRKQAGIDTSDTIITPRGTEQDGDGKQKDKKFETLNIGGTKFTILSTKDSKLGTSEVKSLTNAKSGLKDLNTALSLIFPDGKYNQKLVGTMNIAPTWSLGLIGSLTGSEIANNARTTIQSMQRAIEIILRERSGAAVPPAELVNYLKLYLPNTFDNEVQARNKIDALLQYFKGSIDGINQGRQKGGANEDPNFVNEKLPFQIQNKTMVDGGKIMGRLLKKQGSIMYIETAPNSGLFQPLVTKSN